MKFFIDTQLPPVLVSFLRGRVMMPFIVFHFRKGSFWKMLKSEPLPLSKAEL